MPNDPKYPYNNPDYYNDQPVWPFGSGNPNQPPNSFDPQFGPNQKSVWGGEQPIPNYFPPGQFGDLPADPYAIKPIPNEPLGNGPKPQNAGYDPSMAEQLGATSLANMAKQWGQGIWSGMTGWAQQQQQIGDEFEQARKEGRLPSNEAIDAAIAGTPGFGVDAGTITGYHGSGAIWPGTEEAITGRAPFDWSRLGHGAGQVYGHGAYSAAERKLPEDWAKAMGQHAKLGNDEKRALSIMFPYMGEGNYQQAADLLTDLHPSKWVKRYGLDQSDPRVNWAMGKMMKWARSPRGHLYEFNMDVDRADLLPWDKPFHEWPKDVQDRVADQFPGILDYYGKNITGQQVYGSPIVRGRSGDSDLFSRASTALEAAGVPGHIHEDWTWGYPAEAYNIFPPADPARQESIIRAMRIYGLPGMGLAGGAAAMADDQAPWNQ